MRRVPVLALLCLALVAAATVAVVGTPGTAATFTRAITNPTNSARSSMYRTCRAAALGETGTRAAFALPMADSPNLLNLLLLVYADDITNNTNGFAYPGPPSLVGSVDYSQPGPCPRDSPASTSVYIDGTASLTSQSGSATAPAAFSVEAWFRTTTAGGKIIGYGSSSSGTSSTSDRHLYVDSTGRLEFGVLSGGVRTAVQSPGTVTDGAWHSAVGTLSSAGMVLYLDGAQVASSPATTSAQSYSGYWRIGYDTLTGWPNDPGNDHFKGYLAWVSVYGYALSALQVSDHDAAGS